MPRMALYSMGLKKFTTPGEAVELPIKVLIGCGAGAVGSIIGVPADVAMVRYTCDISHSTICASAFGSFLFYL